MNKLYTALTSLAALALAANAGAEVHYYANATSAAAESWNTESATKWTVNGTTFVGAEAIAGNVYHVNGYTLRAGRIGTATGGASPVIDAPNSTFLGGKLVIDAYSASSGLAGTGAGTAILLFELASTMTGPRLGTPGTITQGSYTANIVTGTSTVSGSQHLRFSTGITTLNGTIEVNGLTTFSVPNSGVNDTYVLIKSAIRGGASIDISGGSGGGAIANGWMTWAFEDLSGWTGKLISVQTKNTISFTRNIDFRVTNPDAALAFPSTTSVGFINLSANVAFASGKVSFGTNILPDGTYTAAQLNAIWNTGGYATLPFASGTGTLTVANLSALPAIMAQPQSRTIKVGQSVSFVVLASGSAPLQYQWFKDGVALAAATGDTYSINGAQIADSGRYTVKVSNSAGEVVSAAAVLTVNSMLPPVPTGFAASATGGGSLTAVEVTTAAAFKTLVESTSPAVITVSGQLNLSSIGGSVKVGSKKTIQGADATATIIGCLDLGSGGVTDVVIRGLTITNPGSTIVGSSYTDGGDGIKVRNASNVYITQCTLVDCADDLVEIGNGADNVTISWCEFYYTADQRVHRSAIVIGDATGESKPLRVTLHHNWWSDRCDVNMPLSNYGNVHMYNNVIKSAGNATGSVAADRSQFLVERNRYENVNSPLFTQRVNAALAAGAIRSFENVFTNTTGNPADAGTATVFTPTYSYELLATTGVSAAVLAGAGNLAGGFSESPVQPKATITSPAASATEGDTFTLTAAPTGFTARSYQWRFNNANIAGATTATYASPNARFSQSGIYTVAIGHPSGSTVVSAPLAFTVNPMDPTGTTGLAPEIKVGTGGGGAPSTWFLGALATLALVRRFTRPRTQA